MLEKKLLTTIDGTDVSTLDVIIIHDRVACLWNACATGAAFEYSRPLTLSRCHYFSHMDKPEGRSELVHIYLYHSPLFYVYMWYFA